MKKVLSMVLAGLLALSMSAIPAFAAETEGEVAGYTRTEAMEPVKGATEITVCVPDPESSYIGQAATEFMARATNYSNGTLSFKLSSNGSLYGGDTAAGIKQLSAGSLQIVILATSGYTQFVPEYNIISVPFMFDDLGQLCDFLNSETGVELMNSVESLGIKTIGSWTRSFRVVTNSKRPINSPDDLKGLVLRVPNNSLYVDYFSACGAVATPMNFSEVYNALQLNTLDGQENPVDVPFSNKFYEVQKYVSETDHIADAWLVGINQKLFDSLTEEQQEALTKAGAEVQQWNVDFMNAENGTALQTLIDNGMEYNTVDEAGHQAFVEISKDLYDNFKKLIGDDELFNKVTEFVGKS